MMADGRVCRVCEAGSNVHVRLFERLLPGTGSTLRISIAEFDYRGYFFSVI